MLLDYTAALSQVSGVGRYTRSLVAALDRARPPDVDLALWSARVRPIRTQVLPRTVREVPIPERWLTVGWQRLRLPLPVEVLAGRADVVHAPDFVAPPHRAPAVVTIHDLSYLVTPQFAYPNLRRYLATAVPRGLRGSTGIVAVSRATAEDLTRFYDVDPARVTVIPEGVDPAFRAPADEVVVTVLDTLGIRRPYFLIVGTIEPRKNHLGVLTAFEQLARAHADVSLVIVGRPGWMSSEIMAAIDSAASRLSVHHLGGIDDEQLAALYAGSVALVYPSWYEGFGLPVVEAMACGTAVITSDRGSLAEVAGDDAVTVDPSSPESIAAAMESVLDDSAFRQGLIARGIERAATFNWDAAAAAHIDLYRRVVAADG
ncbi:MAG TPA: glycosyltransferase family 1 protein [Thermomicrobiaceae bacterium]|nr:glycosyltransferase family 1 protein [Thermomicrobiaceae bacterium]